MTALTGWIKKLIEKEPASCLACGECCRQFSWHLSVSARDIDRWKRLGRDDLLAHVNHLGWIWVDPETKERLPVCPFLEQVSPDKAICSIHNIKPDICRAYPKHVTNGHCLKGVFLS